MTLRLALALVAFVWLTGAKAAEPTYTLWAYFYDPDRWAMHEEGLTLEECNREREHFHFRGEAMWRQAEDKDIEKHRPYCVREK